MDDYELEKYCDAHPYCGCNRMKCPGVAASIPELQNDNNVDEERFIIYTSLQGIQGCF